MIIALFYKNTPPHWWGPLQQAFSNNAYLVFSPIDATQHNYDEAEAVANYGVFNFPTLMAIDSDSSQELGRMDGRRSSSQVINFVQRALNQYGPPPVIQSEPVAAPKPQSPFIQDPKTEAAAFTLPHGIPFYVALVGLAALLIFFTLKRLQ